MVTQQCRIANPLQGYSFDSFSSGVLSVRMVVLPIVEMQFLFMGQIQMQTTSMEAKQPAQCICEDVGNEIQSIVSDFPSRFSKGPISMPWPNLVSRTMVH